MENHHIVLIVIAIILLIILLAIGFYIWLYPNDEQSAFISHLKATLDAQNGQWVMSWVPPTFVGNDTNATLQYQYRVFNASSTPYTLLQQGSTGKTFISLGPLTNGQKILMGVQAVAAGDTAVSYSGWTFVLQTIVGPPNLVSADWTLFDIQKGNVSIAGVADTFVTSMPNPILTFEIRESDNSFAGANFGSTSHAPVDGKCYIDTSDAVNFQCIYNWTDKFVPTVNVPITANFNLTNAIGSTAASKTQKTPVYAPSFPSAVKASFFP